jgi:hypothetical protein
MKREQCPVCFDFLEVKEVAPCFECGHREQEIEHALTGKHTYAEMRIFGDLMLVLCNFCMVDFGSYHPEFFGLPPSADIGFHKMQMVKELDKIEITKDKYCPTCEHRIQFLDFLVAARELHSTIEQ